MGSPGRKSDTALNDVTGNTTAATNSDGISEAVQEELTERACEFEFFQLVRLLQRGQPDRDAVGWAAEPAAEAVRFGVHPSLAFPPCEIHSLVWRDSGPPLLAIQFFGLTGPVGVLPTFYTEYVLERLHAKDTTLRDFLDIFHHRLLSLFYRSWEKYRFFVPYERGERESLTQHLFDLLGLGTPGLQNRQAIYDQSLLYYSGLLAQQPRSTGALKQILVNYFEVKVSVDPFAGAWRALDPGSWSFLAEGQSQSEQLGVGVIVGDEVWDPQSVLLVRIGPLTMEQYSDFLPDGSAYAPLRAITRFFCGDDVDVEVQLVLRREDAPRCGLGVEEGPDRRLGWTSWLLSRPADRDPDDTLLRLWEQG
jgi:type VI secretion system protein ImpH